ncbi:G-protein-signaling modulator 1-like [Carassius carassius]|uniref:G-protein-signaling modulator 1-like n=1 Tax=Carassius carassius TaxID=217509 RepID=UPI0028696184|nr:G-protein-signaling modulator 1-like [Carassius carassius]
MWALLDIPLRGPHLNSSKFEKALIFSSTDGSAEATMNCSEVNVETSVDKQLEPLLILEEGDETLDVINNIERERTVLRVRTTDENTKDGIREATEGSSHDHNSVQVGKGESEAMQAEIDEERNVTLESQQEETVKDHAGHENIAKMDKGSSDETAAGPEKMLQAETQDKPSTQGEVKLRPKDRLSPDDAKLMLHRTSPDFPDALCELLFALQEGRRLNDQRCSFRLEGRRRCYSEPSTPRHSQRVVFSSMTSLQKEEFFDLLATSQGRRLDDQRAELQNAPSAPPPALPKAKQRKSSWKIPEVTRAVPVQTPKEDFYNMIVNSQAQGRLEEQRSAAPGPMDDEDFFSLLLKVQGGRMDEQRTELKPGH